MSDTIPHARRLYPAERLARMDLDQMQSVIEMARYDVANPGSVYDGMDRESTIATAQRTIADVGKALDTL
jgi:hypothetical protein